MTSARTATIALFGLLAAANMVEGQAPAPAAYTEYRVDALIGRSTTAQGGAGVVIPFGTYVRMGIDAAGGVTWRDGLQRASGRVDAIGRFLLDPFREAPFGLSLGAGLSLPYVDGDTRVRPYLTAVIDIEGRKHGWFTPAFQLGLGGGARVGLVFRSSAIRWR